MLLLLLFIFVCAFCSVACKPAIRVQCNYNNENNND